VTTSTAPDAKLARSLWRRVEIVHAVTYFAPESHAAYEALGLVGYWMGYFAGRAAAMGEVGPGVVEATFFNFSPRVVRRAVPDCWARTTPAAALAARHEAVDAALRRVLGDDVATRDDVVAAAQLTRPLAEAAREELSGRPLFAGHADQPWPDDDAGAHMQFWWAATLLREHRGDGHIAALVDAEVGACDALVLHAATGVVPREALQGSRKWTDDEWTASVEGLAARGWVDADGSFTEEGRAARDAIEDRTDVLALGPLRAVGADVATAAMDAAQPLARAVLVANAVPAITPVGAGDL